MTKRKCDGQDVMHVGPQVGEDGSRLCVRHTKDHQFQQGMVKPLKNGESVPPGLSCLMLEPREDGAYDVNELISGNAAEGSSGSGPAMVNSEKFKTGWDRVFGKTTVGVA